MKETLLIIFCFLITSCGSNTNNRNIEYYKTINTTNIDSLNYVSFIKIENDSFLHTTFQDSISAIASHGIITKEKIFLVLNTRKIALNTGQNISIENYSNLATYEFLELNDSLFLLSKSVNGEVDSTYKNKQFKLITKKGEIEKWLLFENKYFQNFSFRKPNKPPLPKLLQKETTLRTEVNTLGLKRNKSINELAIRISKDCEILKSDSIILNLVVYPNGEIKSYKMIELSKTRKMKKVCLESKFSQDSINLGEVKIIPNARSGSKAKEISYNIPLPKK